MSGEKHVVTLSVEREAWKQFRAICRRELRSTPQQLEWFLKLMAGLAQLISLEHRELEERIVGAFQLIRPETEEVKPPAGNRIVDFPQGAARQAIVRRGRGW